MTPSAISPEATLAARAATASGLPADALDGPHLRPGVTASRIADYSELFKLRVTAMVVLTAWAGFYLGSLRTGVTSMQGRLILSW